MRLPRNLLFDDRKAYDDVRRRIGEFVSDVLAFASDARDAITALQTGPAAGVRAWGRVVSGSTARIVSSSGGLTVAGNGNALEVRSATPFPANYAVVPSVEGSTDRRVTWSVVNDSVSAIWARDSAGSAIDLSATEVTLGFVVVGGA